MSRDVPPGEWIAANRARWDERVPLHTASDFYDVEGFRGGREALRPFELDEVGVVAGKRLVHLQCHFGQDSLAWARHGASVTGLDFSEPAVRFANGMADELGLDARFVCADVYDAPAALGMVTFDVVYTGLGALNWLPDLRRWARVVASLVAPGGFVYLAEFHPFAQMLADDERVIAYDYFGEQPIVYDEGGTYADPGAATRHNRGYERIHPLGAVVSSLLEEGLRLDLLHEYPVTLWPQWPDLWRDDDGYWRLPVDAPAVPLIYTVRATKPASSPDGSG